MRTQVGIVGAGPAGLVLALLLRRAGIDSVIIEDRSREYIEHRIRAGLLEQWVTDLLVELGVGERMRREGMFHRGIFLSFDGALHHIDFRDLIGKGVTIYGQQEVVKDLVARLARRRPADPVRGRGRQHSRFRPATGRASASATTASTQEIDCDFIGGCDGFHGICRPSYSGRRAAGVRARVSVRLARHPRASRRRPMTS